MIDGLKHVLEMLDGRIQHMEARLSLASGEGGSNVDNIRKQMICLEKQVGIAHRIDSELELLSWSGDTARMVVAGMYAQYQSGYDKVLSLLFEYSCRALNGEVVDYAFYWLVESVHEQIETTALFQNPNGLLRILEQEMIKYRLSSYFPLALNVAMDVIEDGHVDVGIGYAYRAYLWSTTVYKAYGFDEENPYSTRFYNYLNRHCYQTDPRYLEHCHGLYLGYLNERRGGVLGELNISQEE